LNTFIKVKEENKLCGMEMEEIMIPEGFWDDQEWGFRHQTKLLETYRDVWVAIVDKAVVAAGKDLGKVETPQ